MPDFEGARARMVQEHLVARGIREPRLLDAMRTVPREAFVARELAELAYDDTPLPIAVGQTISQPFIVAEMIRAAEIAPGERVLEVGAGSGYAAAVMSRIAGAVFAIERHEELARAARERCRELGYDNVHVLHGDGTRGWSEHAPFDAIIVSAGGPSAPPPLLKQLAIGGRLVIPVGETPRQQRLIRIVRRSEDEYEEDDLGAVQFVPLIGAEGWSEHSIDRPSRRRTAVARLIRECAEPIDDIDSAPLGGLLERIGDARVVLLGEATHGSAEFYRMRASITRELVMRRGFRILALEADWPDAAVVDRYVRHLPPSPRRWRAFSRFPTWMWKNRQMLELIELLREYNRELPREARVSVYGLDLYSLFTSAAAVIEYLERKDPEAAAVAKARYGCLSPWENDAATYGRAALMGRYRRCEREVVATLAELLEKRLEYCTEDGDDFLNALGNARVVAGAEQYYRVMYYGSVAAWNLRDQHMFETLEALLSFRGPGSKIIVWAHNSHLGDARATEMGARGERNVGSMCRVRFGEAMFNIGFGTDSGTVAAARDWNEPMQIMTVRPALSESYEALFHAASLPAGLLHLRYPTREAVRKELLAPRLERAIGVVYRPETELDSHYFQAVLPEQFDEYVWFDRTRAVDALGGEAPVGVPDTYPFAL